MLNISNNSITDKVQMRSFKSFRLLAKRKTRQWALPILILFLLLFCLILFLPWTQSIKAKGFVTTQQPSERPQSIQSVISGKLEKWYIQEGDYVNKGDTIVFLSEVKSEYFDPNLITRTKEQVNAKEKSIQSYQDKIGSLNNQYKALEQVRDLKLETTRNKIKQKELEITAYKNQLTALEADAEIARNQLNRTEKLHEKGLKSLTDLEAKRLKAQETKAKLVSQKNKILVNENVIENLTIDLESIKSQYADKLAKNRSEKFSAQTAQLDSEANASKLKSKLSNYSERQKFYYVTAPQSGQITKSIKKGIGEIIKEGTDIVTIMPEKHQLAVELYVKPADLPLLVKKQNVLLQFDGWPSIAFSGWPKNSTGTFRGEIMAIDQSISDKGKYRILVKPSTNETKNDFHHSIWPNLLRVGTGSKAFILLKDVPIWYEIWRNLNGFPANYYLEDGIQESVKSKAPLKKVK